MTVCRGRGLALHAIPKCAGGALKVAFLRGLGVAESIERPHHHPALNACGPGEARELYCAGFVRDPVSRLVSCWADKIARHKGRGTVGLLRHGLMVGMSLEEFVEAVPDMRDLDVHTRAQHLFLSDPMDFIGRVETITADWRALQLRFDWLPGLARLNTTRHPPVGRSLRRKIQAVYADDYEAIEALARAACRAGR